MPKRKNEDKIERYQRKIKKLERKQCKRTRILYSSDDSDKSDNEHFEVAGSESVHPVVQNDSLDKNQAKSDDPEPVQTPELDPDILSGLGETTEEAPKFGPNIHEKLACLWLPILRKGLHKDSKEKLIKEYLIRENCPLLQAPILNPEISAAVAEGTRTRDKRVKAVQQQLGIGIVALNKGLELLLDENEDRLQAIKFLSDSCRLLCDLHFVETESRKKFVTPGLDKSFLNIMQDVDRDETLFGSTLSKKLKATKVIEKHGLQIKKPAPNPKLPASTIQPSTSRQRYQGNWGGPPRYSSNRGGRGGQKKVAPTGRRGPSTSGAQQKPTTQHKQRATTQQ